MLVSVIIPNHNRARFLVECLESVFNQSYKDLEIIVVDDHSTDGSLKILNYYSDRVVIINCDEHGAGSARNAGIRASQGMYIALLDSDDIWDQAKISKQMEILISGQVGLVYSHSAEFSELVIESKILRAQSSGRCYELFERRPGTAIVVAGCSSAIFNKSLIEEAGLFDTRFIGAAEDWDFFRRLCRITEIGYIDEVLVHYRRHSQSISRRGIEDFKFGNELAIRKLISEDTDISNFRGRICWARLQIMLAKSSLKEKELFLSLRSIINAILGPNF